MFTNHEIDINTLPKLESVVFSAIDKMYFKVILINLFLAYGSLIISLVCVKIFINQKINNRYFLIGIAFLLVLFLLQCVISKLGFNKRQYALREKDLIYTEGLILNTLTTIPFNRIQHTEVQRTFLARKFGLASLKIYTAGESGGDLTIKGLPEDTAFKINTFLTNLLNER